MNGLLSTTLALFALPCSPRAAAEKLHLIGIMADDHGCDGEKVLATLHIDRMECKEMRFL